MTPAVIALLPPVCKSRRSGYRLNPGPGSGADSTQDRSPLEPLQTGVAVRGQIGPGDAGNGPLAKMRPESIRLAGQEKGRKKPRAAQNRGQVLLSTERIHPSAFVRVCVENEK